MLNKQRRRGGRQCSELLFADYRLVTEEQLGGRSKRALRAVMDLKTVLTLLAFTGNVEFWVFNSMYAALIGNIQLLRDISGVLQ